MIRSCRRAEAGERLRQMAPSALSRLSDRRTGTAGQGRARRFRMHFGRPWLEWPGNDATEPPLSLVKLVARDHRHGNSEINPAIPRYVLVKSMR